MNAPNLSRCLFTRFRRPIKLNKFNVHQWQSKLYCNDFFILWFHVITLINTLSQNCLKSHWHLPNCFLNVKSYRILFVINTVLWGFCHLQGNGKCLFFISAFSCYLIHHGDAYATMWYIVEKIVIDKGKILLQHLMLLWW